MSLDAFLLARFDEDEKCARGLVAWRPRYGRTTKRRLRHEAADNRLTVDPAFVIAEAQAKRAIVEEWQTTSSPTARQACTGVMQQLAVSYAGHPDYDEGWGPEGEGAP